MWLPFTKVRSERITGQNSSGWASVMGVTTEMW